MYVANNPPIESPTSVASSVLPAASPRSFRKVNAASRASLVPFGATISCVTIAALWWKWHVVLGRESRRLGADVYHEVRFEGLVNSGEEECTALCEFLDLPFDKAMRPRT